MLVDAITGYLCAPTVAAAITAWVVGGRIHARLTTWLYYAKGGAMPNYNGGTLRPLRQGETMHVLRAARWMDRFDDGVWTFGCNGCQTETVLPDEVEHWTPSERANALNEWECDCD